MDPYIRAAVNCKTQHDGTVSSFDRDHFVHGYTMRVLPFEEQYELDRVEGVAGRTWGWLELADLDEDEKLEWWYKVRSNSVLILFKFKF